ncbi:MAG: O-antigen ligase family protein [Solirubrobacteraceae bacterium]
MSATLATIAGQSTTTVVVVAGVWALAVAALTLLMRARRQAFPLLAVAALPFRVPIPTESRTVNLLIPLYAVVAAGLIAHLLPRVLRSARPYVYRSGRRLMPLDWLLLASVALYALQISYSADPTKGVENLVFFYLPFLALYALLREAPWSRRLVLGCFGVAVALAVVFAGIGFVEYARKELLLNPRVVAANRFDNYFRVNSLFFDPSIYGRFLVLVMLALTTAVLWTRNRRQVLIGGALLAWLWGGLITSFSQSSIVALLIGLAVIAALRWGVWRTAAVTGALAVLGVVFLLAAPASLHLGLKGREGSANNATNGRASLVTGGIKLFADRPLSGFGSGSFETQYKRHNKVTTAGAASASHTIPLTIAAEQGVLGLVLYAALLLAAALVLLPGAGRSPPRAALAACFAALVAHTFAYADFLEDPFTWTLLALGVAVPSLDWKTAPHAALSRAVHAPPGQPAHAPVGTTSES